MKYLSRMIFTDISNNLKQIEINKECDFINILYFPLHPYNVCINWNIKIILNLSTNQIIL